MDTPAPPVPPAPPTATAPPIAPAPAAPVAPAPPAPGAYPAYAAWTPPATAPQNVLAWVAFGLGLGGILFGLLTSVAAIILGHIARRQIRERGEQGSAAALTGLIAGYVMTGLWAAGIALYVVFFIVIIAVAGASAAAGSGI